MALTHKQRERLQSIHSAAADLQRWAMQQMAADRISRDRCNDMAHQVKWMEGAIPLLTVKDEDE